MAPVSRAASPSARQPLKETNQNANQITDKTQFEQLKPCDASLKLITHTKAGEVPPTVGSGKPKSCLAKIKTVAFSNKRLALSLIAALVMAFVVAFKFVSGVLAKMHETLELYVLPKMSEMTAFMGGVCLLVQRNATQMLLNYYVGFLAVIIGGVSVVFLKKGFKVKFGLPFAKKTA